MCVYWVLKRLKKITARVNNTKKNKVDVINNANNNGYIKRWSNEEKEAEESGREKKNLCLCVRV